MENREWNPLLTSSETTTFLGAFVRGSNNASESNITVEGQVATEGDPINKSVKLNVSVWKKDEKRADVGEYQTNETGYFNITFNYSATHMEECSYGLPIGNITVNVTVPAQPLENIGSATKLYNASIFAQIFNRVEVQKPENADNIIPSYMNETNITVYNSLVYDNETTLTKEAWVNVSLSYPNGSTQTTKNLTVGNGTKLNFSLKPLKDGIYSINSSFNLSRNNPLLDNPWLMAAESYLANNKSAGPTISNGSTYVEVINASKITFFPEKSTSIANRSGDTVHIEGRHLNVTGNHSDTPINLTISLISQQNSSRTYYSETSNFSVNESGYFDWNIQVNSSFVVGQYRIWGQDGFNNCITDELSLMVKSNLTITNIGLPSQRVMTHKSFAIVGTVVDIVDDSLINGTIRILIEESNAGTFSSRIREGSFNASVKITTNVTNPNVTIDIIARNETLYWQDTIEIEIPAYNYVKATAKLSNTTLNRTYTWYRENETLFQGENTSFIINSESTITTVVHITDDFNKTFKGGINISVFSIKGKVETSRFFYPGENTPSFNIDSNSTMEIAFPMMRENVSISILIRGSGEDGGDNLSFPLFIGIGIGVLIAMGIVGVGFFALSGRQEKISSKRTLDEVLEEMKTKIRKNETEAALNLAREAVYLIGKELEIDWKPDWTPREFFLKILKSRKSYSYEHFLKKLYPQYEEALFAERDQKEKVENVFRILTKIEEKLTRKKEKENA